MSKKADDLNGKVNRRTCQWCSIPKQKTVQPLLLCPVCDQAALLTGQHKLLGGDG